MSDVVKEDVVEEVIEEVVEVVEDVVEEAPAEEVVEETVEEVVEEEEASVSLDELYESAFGDPVEEIVEEVVEDVAEEVVEEEVDALPEYTKLLEEEVDLTSDLEVEAINYWGGGDRAEWTKHPENFTEDQKAVFTKHQSAFDKSKIQPVEDKPTKDETAQATADLYKLIQGDEETKKKYNLSQSTEEPSEPQKDDTEKLGKMFEAIESGDSETAKKLLAESLKENYERAVVDATRLAKDGALADVRESKQVEERERWINQVAQDSRSYIEQHGSAYSQYIPQIQRFLELTEMGLPNPVTGKRISTVKEAYDLARKLDSGGGKRVASVRPSPVVAPPAGSGEGSAPKFTDSDLAGDTKSFMDKAWDEAHK